MVLLFNTVLSVMRVMLTFDFLMRALFHDENMKLNSAAAGLQHQAQ
jgi:hypothetical protein